MGSSLKIGFIFFYLLSFLFFCLFMKGCEKEILERRGIERDGKVFVLEVVCKI